MIERSSACGSGIDQPQGHTSTKSLRADAKRNRERILQVAGEVFASEGLSVSMDAIARRAGFGVGTVYRHFPTKTALYEAIILNNKLQLIAKAEALFHHADPGEAFFGFLTRVIEEGVANKAITDDLAGSGLDIRCMTSSIRQGLWDAFDKLLKRAQTSGAVRRDVSVDDLMTLLAGILQAATQRGPDVQLSNGIVSVVLDGLRHVTAK